MEEEYNIIGSLDKFASVQQKFAHLVDLGVSAPNEQSRV